MSDRSTFYYNPFRRRFIFSIKTNWHAPYGRSREYYETNDFSNARWTTESAVPWTSADVADPMWPYNPAIPAELCECAMIPVLLCDALLLAKGLKRIAVVIARRQFGRNPV